MGKSIFELTDKFGYEGPLGDWLQEESALRKERESKLLPEQRSVQKKSAMSGGDNGGVIIKKYNYSKIEENYEKDGQSILHAEYEAGKEGTNSKERWKKIFGVNTCAIKLSRALNHAGYYIPDEKTVEGRYPYTSNINAKHNYILGADEMGAYLKKALGKPTLKSDGPINSDEQLDLFIQKIEKWEDYKGILYLDSSNPTAYGAGGHVDLIYEDWGSDAYIYGTGQELDDYIDWRNNDGWFNNNAQLGISIWLLEGNLKK